MLDVMTEVITVDMVSFLCVHLKAPKFLHAFINFFIAAFNDMFENSTACRKEAVEQIH